MMPNTPSPDSTASPQTLDREQIKLLCGRAYEAYDKGDFKAALRIFYQGWIKLPKPQNDFQESSWVLTGIGDSYFKLQQFQQAVEALRSALCCPDAEKSAFIHLRLGQSLLELGEQDAARASLHKAYEKGGADLFANEAPQYMASIGDLITP